MSRKNGGEKYVKSFDEYVHLLTMLFAVIMRFDSLREIKTGKNQDPVWPPVPSFFKSNFTRVRDKKH